MHMPLLAFKALYNARKYISRPISCVRSNSDIWFQWRRLQVQFVFWIIFLIIQFPPHLRLFLSLSPSSILNFVKKRDKQNSYMGKSVVFINLSSGLNTLMSNCSSKESRIVLDSDPIVVQKFWIGQKAHFTFNLREIAWDFVVKPG